MFLNILKMHALFLKKKKKTRPSIYLEYDDPDGDSDELGMVKLGDARLGLTLGHWWPGGGVLDAAVSASDQILGLVGGNGIPQSW